MISEQDVDKHIKVVIVDDQRVVRFGLRAMLRETQGIDVVAEFKNGKDFLTSYHGLPDVDVVLLDITMPVMDGLAVLEALTQQDCYPAVIVVTMFKEEAYALKALRAGAKGYLTKECSPKTLVEAITSVAYGGTYLSSALQAMLFCPSMLDDNTFLLEDTEKMISKREMEVFSLLYKGYSIKEISYELGICAKTVSTYKSRLMEKLQISTHSELVKVGINWGLDS